MTKEKLKIKLEKCFENAEKILVDSGSLTPMLDIEFIGNDGKSSFIAVVLAVGDNEKEKQRAFIKGVGMTMGIVERMGKIKSVECVVIMSEAWFSILNDAEYKKQPNMRPSQDPNKREMLIATGLTADGICLMRTKEMFSIEVKGKRHFTLSDVNEVTENTKFIEAESNMLDYFFEGYKLTLTDSPKNDILDKMAVMFANMTLEETLQRSIKVITERIGGVKSEFIKINKK